MKIPNYQVRRNRRGFWEPTKKMRLLGFQSVPCGVDGPDAWATAQAWNDRWQKTRRGEDPAPALIAAELNLSPERAEELTVYPYGSIGEAFRRYRRTVEWAERKAPRTREDWWRGWRRIKPIFGDVDPRTVTLEEISEWRKIIEERVSLREAHRALKIWRALWQVMGGLHYCDKNRDPSWGVRNTAAAGRSQTWTEGEAVRLVKRAWRMGYRGLAAGLAVMWDTQLSPGDVRALTAGQRTRDRLGRAFFTERSKTGAAVGGVLSARSAFALDAYLSRLGVDLHAEAQVIRNRSGQPYLKNAFAEDFREVRAAEFGHLERRQMLDFRRSGAVEAIVGEAKSEQLAHAMGNTLSASNALFETYVPVQTATIVQVAEARRRGRRKLREENG
ncbi:hypothetical protein [Methylobacterium sp. A54F]